MAQFGELINSDIPVVFCFMDNEGGGGEGFLVGLKCLAWEFNGFVNFYTIEKKENKNLCDALMVNVFPTAMIYKDGVIRWRGQDGTRKKLTIAAITNNINIIL